MTLPVRIAGLIVLAVCVLQQAAAQEADAQYLRVAREDGRATAMQTAIASFEPRSGSRVTVDLIAAVHIGDRDYYQDLNTRFRGYDALLFELVMPADADVASRQPGGGGALSGMQGMMGSLLDLSFQLDEIEYDAANFVHADLDADELRDSMTVRGESLYVYFWRLYFAAMNNYSNDPLGVDNLARVLSSGNGYDLKTSLAFQLTDMSMEGDILAGDTDSALIGARNQRAVEVLRRELDVGTKRIGIFYGAAHMPDLADRIEQEFGLEETRREWVDAWRLGAPAATD